MPLRRVTTRFAPALLLTTLGATLVVVAGPAGAQDISTLQSRIDDARSQAETLGAQIQANASAIQQAQAQASAAAAKEAQMTAVLEQGQAQLAQLRQQVATTEAGLARTTSKLHGAVRLLSRRLVAMYEGDVPDAMTVLLDSNGFDDLTSRIEYLNAIHNADQALIDRVRTLRDQQATQLAAVQQARAQQADFNQQLAIARAQIDAVRQQATSQAAELTALREHQTQTLATLHDSIGQWTSQVQRLQQVSATTASAQVSGWMGNYVIPAAIVQCESGGNYGAVNPSSGAGGAYQILPSTWQMYGGQGSPQNAPPAQQDAIAAQIWQDSGPAAWVCAG